MSDAPRIPPAPADAQFHECGPAVPDYGGLRYSQWLRPGEPCVSCGWDPGFPIPDLDACCRVLLDLLGRDRAMAWARLLTRRLEETP